MKLLLTIILLLSLQLSLSLSAKKNDSVYFAHVKCVNLTKKGVEDTDCGTVKKIVCKILDNGELACLIIKNLLNEKPKAQ